MKTELLDFIWDIITEEKIKKLEMENISYTYYQNSPGIPMNGMCRDFFFRTNEGDAFCLTVVIENDVLQRQVELYTYVTSVSEEGNVRGSSLFLNYQKYKKELETIREFVTHSIRDLKLRIHIEKKVRLFFCTGYTLIIENEIEQQWEEIKNNKKFYFD